MSRFKDKPLVVTAVKGSMISFNDDNWTSFSRDASVFKLKTASTTQSQREFTFCSDSEACEPIGETTVVVE